MNLKKLFETQKVLDERIVFQKVLGGRELLPEKILALLTELGELSNEWRGFKFWSENQNPNTKNRIYAKCDKCDGEGEDPFNSFEACSKCKADGELLVNTTNPLLEEYVDCLHFILSIGLELGQEKYIDNIKYFIREEPYMTNDITLQFNYVFSLAVKVRERYKPLFSCFVALGEMLGFTLDEVEAAYFEKNEINHTRQETNY